MIMLGRFTMVLGPKNALIFSASKQVNHLVLDPTSHMFRGNSGSQNIMWNTGLSPKSIPEIPWWITINILPKSVESNPEKKCNHGKRFSLCQDDSWQSCTSLESPTNKHHFWPAYSTRIPIPRLSCATMIVAGSWSEITVTTVTTVTTPKKSGPTTVTTVTSPRIQDQQLTTTHNNSLNTQPLLLRGGPRLRFSRMPGPSSGEPRGSAEAQHVETYQPWCCLRILNRGWIRMVEKWEHVMPINKLVHSG